MPPILPSVRRPTSIHSRVFAPNRRLVPRRNLLTLAIETSCDDTAVAILERHDASSTTASQPLATLHFNEKITADNSAYRGVHPIVSLESHQQNLALLVRKALHHLPDAQTTSTTGGSQTSASAPITLRDTGTSKQRPDFVSVTRGPGMRSNLATGLDTAKGLATAWQIPLVGVHHMQAHALTPRLVSALAPSLSPSPALTPSFPFLSLLVSGGHTLLLHSAGLTEHRILASTADIAVGDAIDKIARAVLPPEWLAGVKDTMYGALLERFAFPPSSSSSSSSPPPSPAATAEAAPPYAYTPAKLHRRPTRWGWSFAPPLSEFKGGSRAHAMEFSFSGLVSSAERIVKFRWDPDAPSGQRNTRVERAAGEPGEEERRDLAREAMRVAFEHLAGRAGMALQGPRGQDGGRAAGKPAPAAEAAAAPLAGSGNADADGAAPTALVVAGGVAANAYLRHVLRAFLDARGFAPLRLVFPPPALCTDNAAMIAWAGVEMFEAGWTSEMGVLPRRKWSLDSAAEDGGVLGVGGWVRR